MISSKGPESASVTAQLLGFHTWESGAASGAHQWPLTRCPRPSAQWPLSWQGSQSWGVSSSPKHARGPPSVTEGAGSSPGLGSPTGLWQPSWPLVGELRFTYHVSLQPLLGISPAPGHSEPLSSHLRLLYGYLPIRGPRWHLCHWILSFCGQGPYGSTTAVCPVEPSPWPVLGTQ